MRKGSLGETKEMADRMSHIPLGAPCTTKEDFRKRKNSPERSLPPTVNTLFNSLLKVRLKKLFANSVVFHVETSVFHFFHFFSFPQAVKCKKRPYPDFHGIFHIFSNSTPQFRHFFTAGFCGVGVSTFALFLQKADVEKFGGKIPEKTSVREFSTFPPPLLLLLYFIYE